MDAPLALYRRYRPDTFTEVIGQDHVTVPLRNALSNNRVNHAYLFSGPRGCGKTTSARILARAINCEKGPIAEPCGVCQSCQDLARGGPGSIDVIEIDAASHGGVDDARDLRERAFFSPVQSRYKIYIIDEAHMVTTQGFNALLKLVEEPPPHLKFIFATTEPEKVIGTIRSRTHHYPFRLVPPKVLADYLALLCKAEGVSIAPAALPLVVRAGAGSVRDSLSVLDQLIGGADADGVTYRLAVALLGFTPDSLLDACVDGFAAHDSAAVFEVIEKVIETGQDPKRFAEDLLRRLRDLVILSAVPSAVASGLIDVAEDQGERLQMQAAGIGAAELTRAADIVAAGLLEMRGATAPRLQLELICAKVLLPGADDSTNGIQARLDRIERRLTIGVPAAGPASSAGTASPVGTAPAAVAAPAAAGTESAATGTASASAAGGDGTPASAGQRAASGASAQGASGGARSAAWPKESAAGPPGSRSGVAENSPGSGEVSIGPGGSGESGSDPSGSAPGTSAPGTPEQAGSEQSGSRQAEPGQAGSGQAGSGQRWTQGADGADSVTAQAAPNGADSARDVSGRPTGPRSEGDRPAEVAAGAAAVPASSGSVGLADVRRLWPEILEAVKAKRRFAWIMLSQNAQVIAIDEQTITLGLVNAGARESFARSGSDEILRQAMVDSLGLNRRVEAVVDPSTDPAAAGHGSQGAAGGLAQPAAPSKPPQRNSAAWDQPPSAAPASSPAVDEVSNSSAPQPTGDPSASTDAYRGPGSSGSASADSGAPGPSAASRGSSALATDGSIPSDSAAIAQSTDRDQAGSAPSTARGQAASTTDRDQAGATQSTALGQAASTTDRHQAGATPSTARGRTASTQPSADEQVGEIQSAASGQTANARSTARDQAAKTQSAAGGSAAGTKSTTSHAAAGLAADQSVTAETAGRSASDRLASGQIATTQDSETAQSSTDRNAGASSSNGTATAQVRPGGLTTGQQSGGPPAPAAGARPETNQRRDPTASKRRAAEAAVAAEQAMRAARALVVEAPLTPEEEAEAIGDDDLILEEDSRTHTELLRETLGAQIITEEPN